MITVLHTADWHFKPIPEFYNSYNQILSFIKTETPDVVVISGDVCDSRMIASTTYSDMLECITRVANYCPVIITYGTPSHDFKGCFDPFAKNQIYTKYPVTIIDNVDYQQFNIKDEAVIMGMAWPMKYRWLSDDEMLQLSVKEQNELYQGRLESYFEKIRNIRKESTVPLLWFSHLQLEGSKYSSGQDVSSDTHSRSWVENLADYVGLGHIHNYQPYYVGSIYNKNWGEMENKYFNVITISGNKVKVKPHLLKTPMMIKIECNYNEYQELKQKKTIQSPDSIEIVKLDGANVWCRLILKDQSLINYEDEMDFWKNICNMRLDLEKVENKVLNRIENYNKNISLLEKAKLWATNKNIELTDFQIHKIKELE